MNGWNPRTVCVGLVRLCLALHVSTNRLVPVDSAGPRGHPASSPLKDQPPTWSLSFTSHRAQRAEARAAQDGSAAGRGVAGGDGGGDGGRVVGAAVVDDGALVREVVGDLLDDVHLLEVAPHGFVTNPGPKAGTIGRGIESPKY